MKITRVETWMVPVALETPYAVAYAAACERTTLAFVRLETDRGVVGYGSAGCDSEVTGETADTVIAAIESVAEPILRGADPREPLRLLHELTTALGAQPSALAAIDMALFDIIGKVLERPLWRILGGLRDRIATSITIGILSDSETFEAARRWHAEGFTCLKIKGGLDVESDIRRAILLREMLGHGVELRFDANQGYSVADSIRFANESCRADVSLLEQPTDARRPEWLGEVRGQTTVPIMADECVKVAADALCVVRSGWADMLNVKLMKCGGVAAALQIEAVADAANVPIMVGCMDESALGIAAGLHFALARPATTLADLDGHIGLIGDPVMSGLRLVNGVLFPPDGPGLGIEPRSP